MNRKTIVILGLLIIAGALALFALPTDRTDTPAPDLAALPAYDDYASATNTILGHDILFSIPIGKDGITYEGLGWEQMPWGPSALKVDTDGDFWIADAAAHRLLEYDKDGNQLSVVDLSNSDIVGIQDFALVGDEIAILDLSANEPAIVWVDYAGNILRHAFIPYDDAPMYTNLYITDRGKLAINKEPERYALVGRTDDSHITLKKEFSLPAHVAQGSNFMEITVKGSSGERTESFLNEAGGHVLFNRPSDGSIFVKTDEFGTAPDGSLDADSIIHRYTEKLAPNGVARILPSERFVPINSDLAVTDDGSVYYLLGTKDAVHVLKLRFFRELPRVLPQGPPPNQDAELLDDFSRGGLSESPTSCVSRSTMMNRAWSYRSNETYLSTKNISGSCSGRSKPRYLSTAKYYFSVSYDWGGFDSVELFNYAMSIGRQAGDINTSTESCSRGVDCSGFVSRVWGLSSKYSTTTLPNISTRFTSRSSFRQGDIVNRAGDHTAMFYANNGTTKAYWYEATTNNQSDRVVRASRPWTDFDGYKYYRYNNVCN